MDPETIKGLIEILNLNGQNTILFAVFTVAFISVMKEEVGLKKLYINLVGAGLLAFLNGLAYWPDAGTIIAGVIVCYVLAFGGYATIKNLAKKARLG